jgi:myosin heavy subunit
MLQEEHAMLAAKCADMEAHVNMIAKKREEMDAEIMELNAVLNELHECKQAMKSSGETDAAAKKLEIVHQQIQEIKHRCEMMMKEKEMLVKVQDEVQKMMEMQAKQKLAIEAKQKQIEMNANANKEKQLEKIKMLDMEMKLFSLKSKEIAAHQHKALPKMPPPMPTSLPKIPNANVQPQDFDYEKFPHMSLKDKLNSLPAEADGIELEVPSQKVSSHPCVLTKGTGKTLAGWVCGRVKGAQNCLSVKNPWDNMNDVPRY